LFELFGQVDHVVSEESGDRDAFFAECVQRWATQVGIASDRTDPEDTSGALLEPVRE
jgi:hypothetical protein